MNGKQQQNPMSKKKTDGLNQASLKGEEFSKELRHTNEVASTEYTGGGKKRGSLTQDRLETGE